MAQADELIRAFIAIEPGAATRAALADLVERLRRQPAKVSWVAPDNLHLTLRFLGDVEASRLDGMGDRLAEALAGTDAFTLHVCGVGAFPNLRKPSVVWAGFDEPPSVLFRTQAIIETIAQESGLDPERRAFVPHVTLGRVRGRGNGTGLGDMLASEDAFDAGDFPVGSVSLFSSRLTRNGAVHRRLRDIPF